MIARGMGFHSTTVRLYEALADKPVAWFESKDGRALYAKCLRAVRRVSRDDAKHFRNSIDCWVRVGGIVSRFYS